MTVKLPALTRRSTAVLVGLAVLLAAAGVGWRMWEQARIRPSPEAEAFYQKGVEDLHAGAYFAATKALGEAVRIAPRFTLAHARLAEAWVGLDLTEKASNEMLLARRQDLSSLSQLQNLQLEAIDLTITRDFAEAVAKYQQMLPLAKADASEAAMDLGRAYERLGLSDKAMDNFRRTALGPGQHPDAWLRLAVIYSRSGNNAMAEEAFQKAEQLFHLTSNLEGLIQLWKERGVAATRRGQYDLARHSLQTAIDMARPAGNVQQQISAELSLANNAYQAGDATLAEKYAQDALQLAQLNHMESLAVGGLINLGNAHVRRRDFPAAERYLQDALTAARGERSPRLVALCQYSLAALHDQTRQYREASQEAREALGYYQTSRANQETFDLLTLLGRTQRAAGDYAAASTTFQSLLDTARKAQDRPQMALAHESLARLAYAQEQYPKAMEAYQKALELSADGEAAGYAALHYGNLLWRLGRYPEAAAAFDRAADNGKKLAPLLPLITQARAEMLLSQNRYAEAIGLARQVLAAGGDATRLLEIRGTICLAELGRANRATGDCEAAAAAAEAGADVGVQLRGRFFRLQVLLAARDRNSSERLLRETQLALSAHPESRWRFLALLSRVDPQYSAPAQQALNELNQAWGDESFRGYLTRPDVSVLARPLLKLSSANPITR